MPPKAAKKSRTKPNRAKRPTKKVSTASTPLPTTPITPRITLKIPSGNNNTRNSIVTTPNDVAGVTIAIANSEPNPFIQPVLPPPPTSIPSPQIKIWVIELEIRYYLDGERFAIIPREVSNQEGRGTTYEEIKKSAEAKADSTIADKGYTCLRRDPLFWYATYGRLNNPSQPEIGGQEDFDVVINRVRNSDFKSKLLII